MTNQAHIPVIQVSHDDMQRYRENNGEIGFDPTEQHSRFYGHLCSFKDLKPETQEKIRQIIEADQPRMVESKRVVEQIQLQEVYNLFKGRGTALSRDTWAAMCSMVGYQIDTAPIPQKDTTIRDIGSYRVSGMNRITSITDYTRCAITFIVTHAHCNIHDLCYVRGIIHDQFHKARLDFGYDDVYMDLTEKDTLVITGMYNSSENGPVVKTFLKLKLTSKGILIERG